MDGFAGSPYAVEHFVVTHRAPERAAKGEMTFTFVTEGVEGAVERANSPLGASPSPTRPPNGGSRRRIHAKADDGEGAPGVLSRAARGRAQRRQGRRPAPHTTPVCYAYEPGGEVTFFTGTQGRRSRKADLVREAGRLSLTVQREDFPYGYVTVEGSVVGERGRRRSKGRSPSPAGTCRRSRHGGSSRRRSDTRRASSCSSGFAPTAGSPSTSQTRPDRRGRLRGPTDKECR